MRTHRLSSSSFLLTLAVSPLSTQTSPFAFAKEQRVYIVAVDSSSRNASVSKADLQLERYTRNAFNKYRAFHPARTLHESDFVFFVMLDADSPKLDEVALVVSPSVYQEANGNLDVLRNAALWQSDNRFRNAGAEVRNIHGGHVGDISSS